MSKLAIGLFLGGACCLGLSIVPIPFQRWVIHRQASGIGAIGFFTVGYFESERKKEEQRAIDLWNFQQKQRQKALDVAIEPVLAEELIQKEQIRSKYSVADTEEEMRGNFTVLQVDRYGEEWLKSQLPQPEPSQIALPELETETEPEPFDFAQRNAEEQLKTLAAKKAKLLKLINEHESGWIGQLMQKPLLIYGDMGSFKSYFAAFLALCRYYLRGHQIISIADPHFHQNSYESWKCLVDLGVSGYGANQNYFAVGEQLNAMYARFAVRTLKDKPLTSIWDEVTGYSSEEGTIEPAKKLIRKVIGDPRKANEAPILIGHDNTLIALGGSEGFSKSRDRGIIQLELYSDSENRPLFKGKLSGIKNEDGEFVEAQKVSIAAEWIRPEWVYNLFNTDTEKVDESLAGIQLEPAKIEPEIQPSTREIFLEEGRRWLKELYDESPEVEVRSASDTTPWDEVPEVTSEVPEVRISNTSKNTSLLPEDVRSKALTKILALLGEAGSASDEVISLMPVQPDRAVWIGIKLLGKSMTAASRDIFGMGTGGKKFQTAKGWYESLKKEFENVD